MPEILYLYNGRTRPGVPAFAFLGQLLRVFSGRTLMPCTDRHFSLEPIRLCLSLNYNQKLHYHKSELLPVLFRSHSFCLLRCLHYNPSLSILSIYVLLYDTSILPLFSFYRIIQVDPLSHIYVLMCIDERMVICDVRSERIIWWIICLW